MFNITIDGKAGSGKSTIAKGLSKRLNIKNFNTGAVYRGIACEYLKQYKDKKPTEKIIKDFLNTLEIKILFIDNVQNVIVNGTNFTPFLREEKVSNATPFISGYDNLREKVREIQRKFADENDCIIEGRDIGRVVLKNAQCKFFFTASVTARAQRRFKEIKEEDVSLKMIKKDIEIRDEMDTDREFGAMLPAKDAIIIDNSNYSIEQTLDICQSIVEEKRILKS